jgi:hypothetical protein
MHLHHAKFRPQNLRLGELFHSLSLSHFLKEEHDDKTGKTRMPTDSYT